MHREQQEIRLQGRHKEIYKKGDFGDHFSWFLDDGKKFISHFFYYARQGVLCNDSFFQWWKIVLNVWRKSFEVQFRFGAEEKW